MKAGLAFAGFLKVLRQFCEVIGMGINREKVEPDILRLWDYIREVKAIDLLAALHCWYGACNLEVVGSVNGHFEWADIVLQ